MHCPAKINLYLKVLDKREDGYHNLETIFLPIMGLADELKIKLLPPGEPPHMTVTGPFQVPTDSSNLCFKAVKAFQETTGHDEPVAIELTKNIPVAAGLGGGSSDAATTLKILNRLYHSHLDVYQLRAIASKLGADVPFFIEPQVSLATGIGDLLTPAPLLAHLTVLLVTPCFPLPVAWAYQHRYLPQADLPELIDLQRAMAQTNPQLVGAYCRNDLEHAILDKFPILTCMRDKLLELGAFCAHVSGSGPSLFALLSPLQAEQIRDDFSTCFPGFPRPNLYSVTPSYPQQKP